MFSAFPLCHLRVSYCSPVNNVTTNTLYSPIKQIFLQLSLVIAVFSFLAFTLKLPSKYGSWCLLCFFFFVSAPNNQWQLCSWRVDLNVTVLFCGWCQLEAHDHCRRCRAFLRCATNPYVTSCGLVFQTVWLTVFQLRVESNCVFCVVGSLA